MRPVRPVVNRRNLRMEAMMGICTTDNIVRRLRGISAKTGVVLRYNEVNLMTGSGPVLHHRVGVVLQIEHPQKQVQDKRQESQISQSGGPLGLYSWLHPLLRDSPVPVEDGDEDNRREEEGDVLGDSWNHRDVESQDGEQDD